MRSDRGLAGTSYEMRCSTEGSEVLDLSDFRKVDKPGACIVAPCAMLQLYETGLGGPRNIYLAECGVEGLLSACLFLDACVLQFGSLVQTISDSRYPLYFVQSRLGSFIVHSSGKYESKGS